MSFDSRELRDALGRFATGVTIVTTMTPDQKALGMTANSFSSVSLDPPLVLWNLQNTSDVYEYFSQPRHFAINVLTQEQLALSNQYARKDQHELDPEHYRMGRHGAPVIRDALMTYECELYATHEGGDHLIILGRVLELSGLPEGNPLLFYAGSYGELH